MKAFTFFSLLWPSAWAQSDGLTVATQQGLVAGTQVLPTVRQFLGIPFATAKRWTAPKPAPMRPGVFQATKFGDSCIQNLGAGNVEFLQLAGQADSINVTSSENCMSVNIWAPSVDRKQKTAVMIWIYGGGFVFGTSNILIYHGTNFVRDNDDLTVVSFNYRLDIFGQPNAPQLGDKNVNFGLLDIDAAVQWVHANIAAFGGDPDRIVLFGQSAGSAAADAYTFAHPTDTIVKGVIEESGTVSGGSTKLTATPTDHTNWDTVAVAVGCGNATTPQQFTCMEGVSAQTLEKAVLDTNVAFSLVTDNKTFFADTQQRAANGNFLKVPLLGGTVANEGDVFVLIGELVTTGVSVPVLNELISDIDTPLSFTCPASVTAIHRTNAKVPTWRYQYQAVFPSVSTRPDLRAYHASEIPMVFGTYNLSAIPATPIQIALSHYVQRAWVAFARDPQQGLLNFGWPVYDPNTASLAQLGSFFNQTGVVFTQGSLIDFVCKDQAALVAAQVQVSSISTT